MFSMLKSVVAVLFISMVATVAQAAYKDEVLADNPKAYFTFDEASGNAIDQQNAGNQLVPVDGATRVTHASLGNSLQLGSAADFAGNNGIFQLGTVPLASNTAWGIEYWVQTQTTIGQAYLINNGNAGPASNNAPAVIYNFGSPTNRLDLFAGTRTSGSFLTDTSWHHVLMVLYGNGTVGAADRFDVYMDGAKVAGTSRGDGFSLFGNWNSFRVGGIGSGQGGYFNGRIDELAFYDFVGMTESQIAAASASMAATHFEAAVPEPTSVALLGLSGLLAMRRRRR